MKTLLFHLPVWNFADGDDAFARLEEQLSQLQVAFEKASSSTQVGISYARNHAVY